VKIPTSFIFCGKQGTGASTMMRLLHSICRDLQTIDSANPKDFFDTHAEGFYGKLFANLNEISLKKSYSFKEEIKSAITEDVIRVNPKNVRPYDINNYAHITFTTNNQDGLPIDVTSGDRRFTAFTRSSRLNKEWGNEEWSSVLKLKDDVDFVNALFWYLMTEVNVEGVNWEKDRPKTKIYDEMVEINAPPIASFMEWFVTESKFVDYDITPSRCKVGTDIGDCDVIFNEHHLYNESIKLNPSDFYQVFVKWANTHNMYSHGVPSNKKFAGLFSCLECVERGRTNKGRYYSFVPSDMMGELEEKKWIAMDDE